jgi:hypothetical protein
MRTPVGRGETGGVSGSLTRRQLLVRSGGATAALACLGALPRAAAAGPPALSAGRADTFAAVLGAIDADAAYELADRAERAERFAGIYATADAPFRAYADAVIDAIERAPDGAPFSALAPEQAHAALLAHPDAGGEAIMLASLPYTQDDSDSHQIGFTVTA